MKAFRWWGLLPLCFLLHGCASMVTSAAVSVATTVAIAAVTTPIKVGVAVVDALVPDDDEKEDKASNDEEAEANKE